MTVVVAMIAVAVETVTVKVVAIAAVVTTAEMAATATIVLSAITTTIRTQKQWQSSRQHRKTPVAMIVTWRCNPVRIFKRDSSYRKAVPLFFSVRLPLCCFYEFYQHALG